MLQVDALYQRDVARRGGTTDTSNEDYKKFAAEMGFSDAGPPSSSRPSFENFDGPPERYKASALCSPLLSYMHRHMDSHIEPGVSFAIVNASTIPGGFGFM